MGDLQIIFVVESNSTCKSDWIYIKDTIEQFYQYDRAHVKLSVIYMDGKGKYSNKEKDNIRSAGMLLAYMVLGKKMKPEEVNQVKEILQKAVGEGEKWELPKIIE